MTKFYCLPRPDGGQTMLNLDNLLYCEEFKNLEKYGNRTVMKLVFVGSVEFIVDSLLPYELYKKLEEQNTFQHTK